MVSGKDTIVWDTGVSSIVAERLSSKSRRPWFTSYLYSEFALP